MFARVQRSLLASLALVSVVPACAGRLEDVIRGQAAGDLSCPEGQVTVRGRSGGGGVRNYVVSACGRERSYQAACNSLGTCVAYPVRDRADASPQGNEDLWADPPADTAAAAPPEDEALSWTAPLAAAEAEASASAASQAAEQEPAEEKPAEPPARAVVSMGEPRAVTLRNECERTVALFIGEDPATGAGRYTSLGSMNTAMLRLRQGEPVWLLDANGAGVTSIGVEGSVEEIAVLEGCGRFVAR